eukprot:SM000023S07605  [mRNA]  locus=s23:457916:459651:+ [translate_table: standard]
MRIVFVTAGQLRAPGPRDRPVECYIRRNRRAGTYTLHLGPQPAGGAAAPDGKFLLAARKSGWRPSSTDYAISVDPRCFSAASPSPAAAGSPVLGRLHANFLSTKFTVFDNAPNARGNSGAGSTPPGSGSTTSFLSSGKAASSGGGSGNGGGVTVAVNYALNVLGTRGPRRITCTLHTVPSKSPPALPAAPAQATATASSARDGSLARSAATAATATTGAHPGTWASSSSSSSSSSTNSSSTAGSRSRAAVADCFKCAGSDCGCPGNGAGAGGLEPMVLKNKPPRWHEQLQVSCRFHRHHPLTPLWQPRLPASTAQRCIAVAL